MLIENLAAVMDSFPEIPYKYFQETTSTNDRALEWIAAGCNDLCLVMADSQTHGRGRLDRKWVTRPGTALAFSLIFNPTDEERNHLQMFSLLGAVAVCQAFESRFHLPAQIKWPNDVLVNRKKLCGILSEIQWNQDKPAGVVVGIGINVYEGSVPRGETLQFPATCVEAEAGRRISRSSILKTVLENLLKWRSGIGSNRFHQYWLDHLAFRGELVSIETTGKQVFNGLLRGVAQDGSLEIELDSGKLTRFVMGDVHLRPEVNDA